MAELCKDQFEDDYKMKLFAFSSKKIFEFRQYLKGMKDDNFRDFDEVKKVKEIEPVDEHQ